MKKRLIYISMAMMALFASCSEDDRIDLNGEDNAIVFGDLKANTRAEITEANQITEFGVFAEMNLGADDTPEAIQYINLLSNERVYRSSDSWQYDNKRYWVNNRVFRFFAVYPLMDDSKITPIPSNAVSNNPYHYYKVSFETPATADTDLMTASATVKTTDDQTTYPTVNFAFEHSLAKVNINVQKNGGNTGNEVIVRSIAISNIKKSGTYNSENNTWQISEGTGNAMNYTRNNLKVELAVDDSDNPIPTSVISGLLFIPQPITEESIQIIVGYTFDGDTYSAQAFIPTSTVSKWESAKEYTYNLVLGEKQNNILFGIPTVSAWKGSERPVGSTIIIQ